MKVLFLAYSVPGTIINIMVTPTTANSSGYKVVFVAFVPKKCTVKLTLDRLRAYSVIRPFTGCDFCTP